MIPSRNCWARRSSSSKPWAPWTAWSSYPTETQASTSLDPKSLLWRRRQKKRYKKPGFRKQYEYLHWTLTHGVVGENNLCLRKQGCYFSEGNVLVRGINHVHIGLDKLLPGNGKIVWKVLQILEDLPFVFANQIFLKTLVVYIAFSLLSPRYLTTTLYHLISIQTVPFQASVRILWEAQDSPSKYITATSRYQPGQRTSGILEIRVNTILLYQKSK